MTTHSIGLICAHCQGTQFAYPAGRELQEEDTITCGGCGAQTTVGEARNQTVQIAEKLLLDSLGDLVKRR